MKKRVTISKRFTSMSWKISPCLMRCAWPLISSRKKMCLWGLLPMDQQSTNLRRSRSWDFMIMWTLSVSSSVRRQVSKSLRRKSSTSQLSNLTWIHRRRSMLEILMTMMSWVPSMVAGILCGLTTVDVALNQVLSQSLTWKLIVLSNSLERWKSFSTFQITNISLISMIMKIQYFN